MCWFDKKKNNDPVPQGMLENKTEDSQLLRIDRLTAEILKQDIEFIRSFVAKLCVVLNEKLALLDGVSQSRQNLDVLVNKFGKAQDNLLAANLGVLSEIRKSIDCQNSDQAQTVSMLPGIIEALNELIESQNRIIASPGNSFPGQGPTLSRIKPVELAERPEAGAKGSTCPDECRLDAGSDNPVKMGEQGAANFEPDDISTAEKNADENTAPGIFIDSEQFSRRLLRDIKQNIFNVFGKEVLSKAGNAGDIPGLECGKIWLLALPPKPNGEYDSTVLQESAFKKIKACLSKNKEETVIAV